MGNGFGGGGGGGMGGWEGGCITATAWDADHSVHVKQLQLGFKMLNNSHKT